MTDSNAPSVAAGIVAFHPDPSLLAALVAALAHDADRVYLFNNAPLGPSLEAVLSDHPTVVALDSGSNVGVGAALNAIALAAVRDGHARLAVFDQDSRAWPGLIPRLGLALDRLAIAGVGPGAVGPRLLAPQEAAAGPSKEPRYSSRTGLPPQPGLVPVDFLPTSGTLFDLEALRATGPFRADFFIDAIDLEWCFRAWAHGISCWLATDVTMDHTVGTGTIKLGFGLTMPNQRPFRMGTYLRNALYGLRLRHVPLGWKLRQALYLPLQVAAFAVHHRFSRAALAPVLAGLRDGLLGRLGPPPGGIPDAPVHDGDDLFQPDTRTHRPRKRGS